MTRYTNQQALQAGHNGTSHGGTGLPAATPEQARALLLAITLVLGPWGWREWLKLRQHGAAKPARRTSGN